MKGKPASNFNVMTAQVVQASILASDHYVQRQGEIGRRGIEALGNGVHNGRSKNRVQETIWAGWWGGYTGDWAKVALSIKVGVGMLYVAVICLCCGGRKWCLGNMVTFAAMLFARCHHMV
jgi:hypothetical protein